MAVEKHGLILGLEYEFLIQDFVQSITGMKIGIEAMVEINIVFYVVSKNAVFTERRSGILGRC